MKKKDSSGRFVATKPIQKCQTCGGDTLRKFCSVACYGESRRGKRREWNYRSARTIIKGYVWIRPDPLKGRAIQEHRWVMEQHLGRPLEKWEVVHHINHDRSDNRIENLQVYENHSVHMRRHVSDGICIQCGCEINVTHHSLGKCRKCWRADWYQKNKDKKNAQRRARRKL